MSNAPPLDLPPGIGAQAFADQNFTGSFGDGRIIVCYDATSRTGAIYHVAQKLWRTWWPVDMATFALVSQTVIEIELRRTDPPQARN